ncbi:hypothetical protein [Actinokineospora cianjurensis]|uniref:Uncharacterized protein n=1 Tax=Actinokineospora cianjurensis TaxID=585224 RepID=A0A421B435_9PSEU|nr:hypothetical protein [Actinokineospora cianjurensis]RLK59048.1 hypothetical protein CLV68_3530 [Actinokineospora cianjurensis]
MTALLGEVTKRLPDRWLVGTLLPGLLWLAVLAIAVRQGHGHPFDPGAVTGTARAIGTLVRDRPTEALAWGGFAVGAAMLTSLAARGLGGAVRSLWWGRWRGPLALPGRLITRLRAHRARRALERAGSRLPERYLPALPTWIGDRLRLVDVRVDAQYGLVLALVWPRLWHRLDADTRVVVAQARGRLDLAATLVGWGVLYLAPVWFWWPSSIIALGVGVVGWRRGRVAAEVFGAAVESTVDLGHLGLAEALGHDVAGGLTPRVADAVNDQLHKGASPQRLPAQQVPTTPDDVTS